MSLTGLSEIAKTAFGFPANQVVEVTFDDLSKTVTDMTAGQEVIITGGTTGIPLISDQVFIQPSYTSALSVASAAQKNGFATIRCVKNGFIVEPCGPHGDDDLYVCKNLKEIVAILTEMRLAGH